jgi:hypothetical protein
MIIISLVSNIERSRGIVPVETKGVEEGRERLHDQEHTKGGAGPDGEADEDEEEVVLLEGEHEHALPEHGGELRVGERQGPQTQVRGSVGDGSEHELDGVDDLVDEDFVEVELLLFLLLSFLVVVGKAGGCERNVC